MPFSAPPTTLVCNKCGWKQTIIPSSDVVHLLPRCPQCSDGLLIHRLATNAEALTAKLGSLLAK